MAQQFKLEDYVTVKERKAIFYEKHVDGRILTDIIYRDDVNCIIKATAYKNKEDQEKNLPAATGIASETKDDGGYANKHAHIENCEESAIGRCLDNMGFSVNGKCSREEIQKVINHEESASLVKKSNIVSKPEDKNTDTTPVEEPKKTSGFRRKPAAGL